MHSAYCEISGVHNGVPYESGHQEGSAVLFGGWVGPSIVASFSLAA